MEGVGAAAGDDVVQERVLPLFQGPAQMSDFGERAGESKLSWLGDLRVLFQPRDHRAQRLQTTPLVLAPGQTDRCGEAGRINQLHLLPTMTLGCHSTVAATNHLPRSGLDHHLQSTIVVLHGHYVETIESYKKVATLAVAARDAAAGSSIGHRRAPLKQLVGNPDS